MAKARYSMEPHSVGQLQYDTVMTATCLVEVETPSLESEGGEGDRGKRESSGTIFRVCRRSAPHTVGHTTSNH